MDCQAMGEKSELSTTEKCSTEKRRIVGNRLT